jgi:hypothetical protein
VNSIHRFLLKVELAVLNALGVELLKFFLATNLEVSALQFYNITFQS